ncbi:hypothetical protein CI109_102574 [Kwoniella shandongensis]|uniref:Uncharacterized protein n=1 Tax=Kwoniella shandongensis TaxID=1734106 RepID=A0A5M6BSL1_9TREE|nr:uncharacterized protein CI109_005809 [Kwoniella shandongensis]KAA5525787.1 hypothetical protein CI109_005809 [Kwoniella shandongensis]
MRVGAAKTLFASLVLASSALAQRFTTTLPFADGDTLVLSTGTNVRGVATTATIATVTAGVAVTTAVAGADDDPLTTTRLTTTARTTTGRTTTTAANGRPTTTAQRVVGTEATTTAAPMRTTTYWVDTGDGYWTDYTWTAKTTALPTVATANVPEGTIQSYASYQSIVNSAVLAGAEAFAANSSSASSGSRRGVQPFNVDGVVGGWMTMVLGMVGAGLGVLVL